MHVRTYILTSLTAFGSLVFSDGQDCNLNTRIKGELPDRVGAGSMKRKEMQKHRAPFNKRRQRASQCQPPECPIGVNCFWQKEPAIRSRCFNGQSALLKTSISRRSKVISTQNQVEQHTLSLFLSVASMSLYLYTNFLLRWQSPARAISAPLITSTSMTAEKQVRPKQDHVLMYLLIGVQNHQSLGNQKVLHSSTKIV